MHDILSPHINQRSEEVAEEEEEDEEEDEEAGRAAASQRRHSHSLCRTERKGGEIQQYEGLKLDRIHILIC